MQKFLIMNNKTALEQIRDKFLTRPELCIPHKENGLHYAPIVESNDGGQFMLCILTNGEDELTGAAKALMVDVLPDNFLPEDLI